MYSMPRWSRFGAFLIDSVTINAFSSFILGAFASSIKLTGTNFLIDIFIIAGLYLFYILLATLYSAGFYIYSGGSFGKFFLKVHIVDEKNKNLDKKTIIKREYIKWLLIYATLGIYLFYGLYCVLNKKVMFHEKITNSHILGWG